MIHLAGVWPRAPANPPNRGRLGGYMPPETDGRTNVLISVFWGVAAVILLALCCQVLSEFGP